MTARALARRSGWAFADQAVSSLTNFALSVAVARAVGVREFGAFGLAVALYLFLVGLSRAIVSEPLLVRFSDARPAERRSAVRQSVGTAVLLGTALGAVTAAGGRAVPGPVGTALLPLGLALPGLLAQDAWRFAFLAGARPAAAVVNDLVWAGAQVVLMGAVLAVGGSVGTLVAAWGLSAAVAAVVGAIQEGGAPAPLAARSWATAHADLASRFTGEFLVRQGVRQLTVYAVGAAGGLSAVAAIRGAQVVFGPLHVLLAGVQLMAVPEAVRLARRSLASLARAVRVLAAALAALGVAAAGIALVLPDSLGLALLGDSWRAAAPVLVPQALVMAGVGASSAYVAGMRAMSAASRTLRSRVATMPLFVAGGTGGAVVSGAAGAIAGIALAQAVATVVFAREFSSALKDAERRPGGGPRLRPPSLDPSR